MNNLQENMIYANPVNINGLDCILYTPHKLKFKWQQNELMYRSLITHNDKVVSTGFPKFFNYGEIPENDRLITPLNSYASDKLDGSLIIRSVINNKVHWRSRGTHILSTNFKIEELKKLINSYPRLEDPNYYPNHSMLFEYVSPNNRIVLRYNWPKLVLLNAISHENLTFMHRHNVDEIAIQCSLSRPQFRLFSSIDNFIEDTKEDKSNIEGYVIISETINGTLLTKIKTKRYLNNHSIISKINEETVALFIVMNDIKSKNEFIKYCQSEDYNETKTSKMLEFFNVVFERKQHVENIITKMTKELSCFDVLDSESIKFINDNYQSFYKNFAFLILRKNYETLNNCKNAYICQKTLPAYLNLLKEINIKN